MTLTHGKDSSHVLRPVAVDGDGHIQVDALSTALPSGAATEATLADIETLITSLAAALVSVATDRLRADIISALPAGSNNIGHVDVDSSALPIGAATAANQGTANTALAAIQTAVETLDNVVSGAEAQVDIVSSALPSGAATESKQDTGNTALAAIETAIEALQAALASIATDQVRVDVIAALPSGGNNIGDVDVVSSALPTDAATATNQSTANTALAAIQTAIEILDNIVSGNEAQVDIVSAPVIAVKNEWGDVLFGYDAHVAESATASASAGTNTLDTGAVPSNKLWVIQTANMVDASNAPSKMAIQMWNGSAGFAVAVDNAPVSNGTLLYPGYVVIPAGWNVRFRFEGCTAGDSLIGRALGYQVSLA